MSDDEATARDRPTVLYCHHCSSAVPSCAQAIREQPLLPLTSLTHFADNTNVFLFFLSVCPYLFFHSLSPFLHMCVLKES